MIGLIYRAPEYSPNGNVPKDAAILEAVGDSLQQKGCLVRYLHEEILEEGLPTDITTCISMARRQSSLLMLQKAVSRGVQMPNSPNAVQVTVQSRSTTLELLQAAGLPVVPFWSYEPSEDRMFQCETELQALLPGWVKAMHPKGVAAGDVCQIQSPLEADARVMQLAATGYTDIIVCRHLEGHLEKVYVVGDLCWPNNDYADLAKKVAQTIGLEILGIDLILTSDGPYIIDVNDFPSFSSCRGEAAVAIANMIDISRETE